MSVERGSVSNIGSISEEEDLSIPRVNLMPATRPAAPSIVPPAAPQRKQPESAPADATLAPPVMNLPKNLLKFAQANFAGPETKRQSTLRLPLWLDEHLDDTVAALKKQGAKKISRESIITEALMNYLQASGPSQ